MPISEELKKKANHYRDSVANAEKEKKKVSKPKKYKVSNDYRKYVNLDKSRFSLENIQDTIAKTNESLGYDGERKYYPRSVNYTPSRDTPVEESPIKVDTAKTDTAKVVEKPKIVEKPKVVSPVDFSTYDLGEYENDNRQHNSSIVYEMPPITRRTLEMPINEQNQSEEDSIWEIIKNGTLTIPGYIYQNKVIPVVDKLKDKLFPESEEEKAARLAAEEAERQKILEEARIARETFVADSLRQDADLRSQAILDKVASMDTSYVVGKDYGNGRTMIAGYATPKSRFLGTNRSMKTNIPGSNILAPWNNWAKLDSTTVDKDMEESHFRKGNRHQRQGKINTNIGKYIIVDNDGKLIFSDTIPKNIIGKITTGYYSTGLIGNKWKHNRLKFMDVVHDDGSDSYNIYSKINPYNHNDIHKPVSAAILFDLPNGEQSWIIPYGRTANQFYNDAKYIQELTGDNELQFVNFDAQSAGGPYMDNAPRYNKVYGRYPNLILRKRNGGRLSLETINH